MYSPDFSHSDQKGECRRLIRRLRHCPPGHRGWHEFEMLCLAILRLLFVPPLQPPITQPRKFSGIDRPDALFANRNIDPRDTFGRFFQELEARLILFEFKNYRHSEVGKEEVLQIRNYLTKAMGRLAFLVSNEPANSAAITKRNEIFDADKVVILFLSRTDLISMLEGKEQNQDPSGLLMDRLEEFYARV